MDLPPPSYEQTIQAIQSCGVTRSNIQIKYEEYLQSDEVTISDVSELTETKLRCVRKAVHPFFILTLANFEQQSAFYHLARKDELPEQRRKAREWIQSKDWTARILTFDDRKGIEVFARRLERACELKAGSVSVESGSKLLTVKREIFANSNFKELGKTVECLMHMIAASDAEEHGVRFGFIGNEAMNEETDNAQAH